MKTVKEIYDYFHQFLNADKKSASLMDFLEVIPDFSEPDSKGNGCAFVKIYSNVFIVPFTRCY